MSKSQRRAKQAEVGHRVPSEREFKIDEAARRRMMCVPQALLWGGAVLPLVAGIAGFAVLGGVHVGAGMGAAQWAAVALLYVGMIALFPAAVYCWLWAGRAAGQGFVVHEGVPTYYVQSGSRRNAERRSYAIESVTSCTVRRRALWLRASCTAQSTGGTSSWNDAARVRLLWVPRTFSAEDEREILACLNALRQDA